jgi:chorismate mutase
MPYLSAGSRRIRHDASMDEPRSEPGLDLYAIRGRIDAVDRRLVSLLAERAALVQDVVRYKRAHRMPVVDRAREDVMLARIADLAKDEGLDSRVAQQVLRTIIDGFTLLEVEELGSDP